VKRILVITLIIVLAAAIGYVVGTENGRQYRDRLVARVRKETASTADAARHTADAATEQAAAAATDAADRLSA
jgi:uncharacterized membrane protein